MTRIYEQLEHSYNEMDSQEQELGFQIQFMKKYAKQDLEKRK